MIGEPDLVVELMYRPSTLLLTLLFSVTLTGPALAGKDSAEKGSVEKGSVEKPSKQTPAERKETAQERRAVKKENRARDGGRRKTRGRGSENEAEDQAPSQQPEEAAGSEEPADSSQQSPPVPPVPPVPRITGRVIHGSIYGELAAGRKVAEVDVSKVFEVIPAYKKIRRENLKKTKAQYHILIAQANQEFQAAVEAEALHQDIVLVVEKGGVSGVPVIDLTGVVRARLEK